MGRASRLWRTTCIYTRNVNICFSTTCPVKILQLNIFLAARRRTQRCSHIHDDCLHLSTWPCSPFSPSIKHRRRNNAIPCREVCPFIPAEFLDVPKTLLQFCQISRLKIVCLMIWDGCFKPFSWLWYEIESSSSSVAKRFGSEQD